MFVRSLLVIGAGAVLSVGWAASATAAPATVRPASNCGWTPANDSNSPSSFAGDGVNIRTGPGSDCTSLGLGYSSDGVTVHCVDLTDDWVYLTDDSTGVTGWAADSLVGGYSSVEC